MNDQDQAELRALRMLWLKLLKRFSGDFTEISTLYVTEELNGASFETLAEEAGLLRSGSRVGDVIDLVFTEAGKAAVEAGLRELELASAIAQREAGTATVTDRFPDTETPQVDVRKVLDKLKAEGIVPTMTADEILKLTRGE